MAHLHNLWLSVKVVSGSTVKYGSRIINCSPEETFGNLLSRLEEEKFSESKVEKVHIEDNIKYHHEVQLDAPVSLCSREQFNCQSIVSIWSIVRVIEQPRVHLTLLQY